MKKVLLFLADGFEEVEAVTPIDFLRRAGIKVTTVGVNGETINGAHDIIIKADVSLDKLLKDKDNLSEVYDGLVFPGGMPGAENIAAESDILDLVDKFNHNGKVIAAICASPGVILAGTGVLDGRRATSYPGFEAKFGSSTEASTERVVVDGNIVTSRGPGTAAEFSIELIRIFSDEGIADNIKNGTIQGF